jgi:hypothetical protein
VETPSAQLAAQQTEIAKREALSAGTKSGAARTSAAGLSVQKSLGFQHILSIAWKNTVW